MDHHSTSAAAVPPEMLAERQRGWHAFTRFTVSNCAAVAAILIGLLLAFRIF